MEEVLETKYVVQNCSALSLRKKPQSPEVLAYMPKGSEVKFIGEFKKDKSWVKVEFNNLEGYCLRKFLAEKSI